MSARKLGRLAGLVFVLAAAFGGIGAVGHVAQHESSHVSAIDMGMLEGVWT
jgi:hypothetical protein